jgi:atypical dual specificity phosphatase
MWTWTLNWGRVRDDLVVGSCPMTLDDIDTLRARTGATALLSVQHDECRATFGIDLEAQRRHAHATGLAYANTPMRDFDLDDQRRFLAGAVRRLAALLGAGHRVYVHCTAGINRAPLTVLGHLTFVEALAPDHAFGILRAGRPQAEPYWDAWRGCREDLLASRREAIAARAFELSCRDPERSAESHWLRAEAQVLREALMAGGAGDRVADARDSR